MSDVWALIDGVHFELEFKTGASKLSTDQKLWANLCITMGAYFIEARSTEQVIEEINKVLSKTKGS